MNEQYRRSVHRGATNDKFSFFREQTRPSRLAQTAVDEIQSPPLDKSPPRLRPLATDDSLDAPRPLSKFVRRGFVLPLCLLARRPDRNRRPPPPRPKDVAMDEPFYYLSAEDVVPEDAVYVIIGGSVTTVESGIFDGHRNLARVELQEGVVVIGWRAFANCPNLKRVDCPSSLRAIDQEAFCWCRRLSEVILREGVEGIGYRAFFACDLRRIAVPSSVAEIGAEAFHLCEMLSEADLTEGLRRIGMSAFKFCEELRRIALPSSVAEVGEEAFANCDNLAAATLAGGTAMVARGAFLRCPRLERIAIPSTAVVVQDWWNGNGKTAYVADTGEIERDSYLRAGEDEDDEYEVPEPAQLVLTSGCLASMSREDLAKFADAINRLRDDRTQGAGLSDPGGEGVSRSIRNCFANRLAEHRTVVAAVLELALWKASMNQGGEASRDDCRRTCGAEVVVGPVLSYLWGPHRRADR